MYEMAQIRSYRSGGRNGGLRVLRSGKSHRTCGETTPNRNLWGMSG